MTSFYKRLLLILCCSFILSHLSSQEYWQRTFGGSSTEEAFSFIQTAEGAYIVAGYSSSFPGPDNEVYIVKTDANGEGVWSNTYGGISADLTTDIIQTSDGGYVLGGYTQSFGAGGQDIYMIKMDAWGNELWSRTFGGTDTDNCQAFKGTPDGGFIAVGFTNYATSASSDVYVVRIDATGNLVWENRYGGVGNELGTDILLTPDGGFIISGATTTDTPSGEENAYLLKIDGDGNELWSQSFGGDAREVAEAIAISNDGGYLLVGTINNEDIYVLKTNNSGVEEWSNSYGGAGVDKAKDVVVCPDGNFAIIGNSNSFSASKDVYLLKIGTEGNELWSKSYGGNFPDEGKSISLSSEGDFLISGYKSSNAGVNGWDMFIIKADSAGNTFSNSISGIVFNDETTNCNQDNEENGLSQWLVKAESSQHSYYTTTNDTGYYHMLVDTGIYQVTVITKNDFWEACEEQVVANLSSSNTEATVDFAMQSINDCPYLEVDISAPFLRRCFESTYTVSYCNSGTIAADDVRVGVGFDEFTTIISSTAGMPIGGVYFLGTLEAGECRDFQITVEIDCESTVLGQTHCASASISPNNLPCITNSEWSGASVELSVDCEPDSVSFLIRNFGATSNTALEYIVIEDEILAREGTIVINEIGAGRTVKVPANGSTYRMVMEQEINHPGNSQPTVSLERCGTDDNGNFSLGFVNNYPEDDADPFNTIDCQENIGSFDPNDKRGFPEGVGAERLIEANVDLEYHIRFQNTGTDTAFRVVILDTISPFLNIESIRNLNASHPYEFDILDDNVLQFSFDDIMLVDSNRNEPASHGFVKFRILQQIDNPIGTEIYNEAAIYFDFNDPIITNQTVHRIGEEFITVSSHELFVPDLNMHVYPNPFKEMTTFQFEGKAIGEAQFNLYDLSGKLVRRLSFNDNEFQFYRNHLLPGMYIYKIESNGQLISTGKIIAH